MLLSRGVVVAEIGKDRGRWAMEGKMKWLVKVNLSIVVEGDGFFVVLSQSSCKYNSKSPRAVDGSVGGLRICGGILDIVVDGDFVCVDVGRWWFCRNCKSSRPLGGCVGGI